MAENPFLDHGFTTGLIEDLEAFFVGDLVECSECEHFVSVEQCDETLVRLPVETDPQIEYMCNECRIELQICDLCQSQEYDGEVFPSGTPKGTGYDVWICNACSES